VWLDALISQSPLLDKREGGNAGLVRGPQKRLPKLLWAGLPNEGISAGLDGNDVFLAIVERPIPDENARGIGEATDDRSRLVGLKIEANRRKGLISIRRHAFTHSIENGFIHP